MDFPKETYEEMKDAELLEFAYDCQYHFSTEWEEDFMDDMFAKYEEGDEELTLPQRTKLIEILVERKAG